VQGGVGLRQVLSVDQAGQVHLVRGLEEHPHGPDHHGGAEQLGEGQDPRPGSDRDAEQRDQRHRIGYQHHRSAGQSIHPRPRREPHHQPGHPGQGGQQAYLERGGVQGEHRDQRQGEAGDVRPEGAGRLPDPQQPEVTLAQHPAAPPRSSLGEIGRRRPIVVAHGWAGTP